jgi:unsaturated rhamnogalacturonyl hydrolase
MLLNRPDLLARIRGLAGRLMAYPYKLWGFGESIGLEALLAASEATGDAAYLEFVRDLLDRWLPRSPLEFADHVAPGVPLLEVYERTGDGRLIDRAQQLARLLLAFPRNEIGAARHRPDHPEFAQYIYVDCMHSDAPFLCRMARLTGDPGLADSAIELLTGQIRALRDGATGLFYHVYDSSTQRTNGAFWGRGNGWAMLGILNTLQELPGETPLRNLLRDYLEQQAAAVASLQDESGHWHTVLDEPGTYLETSLASFFSLAFTRAVQLGLLSDSYLESAELGWSALLRCSDERGQISGVSRATPPGGRAEYDQVPTGGVYPWGHGPAILTAVGKLR